MKVAVLGSRHAGRALGLGFVRHGQVASAGEWSHAFKIILKA